MGSRQSARIFAKQFTAQWMATVSHPPFRLQDSRSIVDIPHEQITTLEELAEKRAPLLPKGRFRRGMCLIQTLASDKVPF
jgi:hypothetical protein